MSVSFSGSDSSESPVEGAGSEASKSVDAHCQGFLWQMNRTSKGNRADYRKNLSAVDS